MSTAILTLALPIIGLIMALVLLDLVRREQRRIRVLRHKLALRTIRDQTLRLVSQEHHARVNGSSTLIGTIEAALETSDDHGVELMPLVVRLLANESTRGAALDRLWSDAIDELIGIVERNSTIASLAFARARLEARDGGGSQSARVHVLAGALANLAPQG